MPKQDFTGSEPILDRPIAFHPCFMPITTKEPLGALYLSQAWFWRDKGRKEDGWIYKTWWEMFEDTGLSQKQQIRVRKVLVTKSWWQEKVEKVNGVPTYHYRIDRVGLMAEIHAISDKVRKEERELSENAQRELSENAQRELSLYKDSENTSREYSPDLERTDTEKLGEAKNLISKTPEPVAQPLEQAQISSVLPVDPNLVDGEKGSAARSISTDKTKTIFGKTRPSVAQKQRAEEANWLSSGVTNKRWKDRQDFDKFVAYVETYTENRRQDPELNPDGTKYGKEYQTAILNRTATTQDENDSMLVCWKTWNLEPATPNYIEPKPEEVVVVDVVAEAAFQANRANLKAVNAARKAAAAADKLKKIEIVRGLYES